ncbi:MAG: CBS domain-containing protein [Candidatus Woesearchaeota archaeon]
MKKIINPLNKAEKIITETMVSEVMITNIMSLKIEDNADEAIKLMAENSISGVLIKDEKNKTIGIVSEGDIIKKVFYRNKNPKKVKLSEIMSKSLHTIKKDASIGNASEMMKKYNISKLPVVDENNNIIGYLTKADLLEKLNEIYYQNTKLKWLPILFLVELIIICILIWMYINK